MEDEDDGGDDEDDSNGFEMEEIGIVRSIEELMNEE